MNLPKKIFFSLLVFLFQFLFSTTYFVRVGIKSNIKKFYLCPNKKNKVLIQLNTREINILKVNQKTVCVFVKPNKIKILDKIYNLPIKLYSEEKLKIDEDIYPGEIEVFSKDGETITLVNIVNIESYLYGVIPYEIDSSWTDEMLKVQSIIARTYSMVNLNRHVENGFDVCSTVHCQVYKGINEDMELRIKKAVDYTKGLVIVDTKNEQLVQTYYHAVCGGATEDVSEIWLKIPYIKALSGVKCDFCKNSPYYSWKQSFSLIEFISKFKNYGYDIGNNVKDINIISKTKHGRIKNLQVLGNKNKIEISGENLRRILGYNKIKSTKIYKIEVNTNEIIFYGEGWGHGVGLCQWGANELTKQGKKFKEVIEYYYPKTKIKKLY